MSTSSGMRNQRVPSAPAAARIRKTIWPTKNSGEKKEQKHPIERFVSPGPTCRASIWGAEREQTARSLWETAGGDCLVLMDCLPLWMSADSMEDAGRPLWHSSVVAADPRISAGSTWSLQLQPCSFMYSVLSRGSCHMTYCISAEVRLKHRLIWCRPSARQSVWWHDTQENRITGITRIKTPRLFH